MDADEHEHEATTLACNEKTLDEHYGRLYELLQESCWCAVPVDVDIRAELVQGGMCRGHVTNSMVSKVKFPSTGIPCLEPDYTSKHRITSKKRDHKRKRMSYAALVWARHCIKQTNVKHLIATADVLHYVLNHSESHLEAVQQFPSKEDMWEAVAKHHENMQSSLGRLADCTRIPKTWADAVKRLAADRHHDAERHGLVKSFLQVFRCESCPEGEYVVSCSLGALATTIILTEPGLRYRAA